jgi:hypothetical protein
MKFLFALMLAGFCAAAAAQGMYKCKDAAGKITYAGKECHLLGLTSAGEVKGKATVVPAIAVPSRQSPPYSPPPADVPSVPNVPAPEASAEKPDRRCFAVKTAKGTATRCNDGPD